MRKVFGIFTATLLIIILFAQINYASANSRDKGDHDKPITTPITSPLTSPITSPIICKPGFGFGDKNHCHFGPPGLFEKLFDISDKFEKLFHLKH